MARISLLSFIIVATATAAAPAEDGSTVAFIERQASGKAPLERDAPAEDSEAVRITDDSVPSGMAATTTNRAGEQGLEKPPTGGPTASGPAKGRRTAPKGTKDKSVPKASVWSKVPNTRIFPRPGNFFIPPSGPGYYTLMDQVRGTRRDDAPQSGYPAFAIMAPGMFDADFRYLDKKADKDKLWYERLKRIRLGKNFMFSTGGEVMNRYNDFNNLTPTRNVYDLTRVRTYGDLWYRDQLRVYGEFIDADRGGGTLPPGPFDIDRADMLDLFVDVKLGEIADHSVYVRGGRQEVLLGSQRLISTVPWNNMRRNFDGVRGFRQGEKFDVDLFWFQPVIPNANQFDSSDHNQQLAGAWFTYRKKKGHFLDFYYLYYNNSNHVVQQGITVDPTRVNTLGTRYAGDRNDYLWDFEYALQLGQHASPQGNQPLVAGMATTGLGYHWSKRCWNPTLWLYYDYASGSANPGAGQYATFNQLFAFGHYYLGWADAVGRQNIQDLNLHLGCYPVAWTTVWLQYHHFWLSQPRDALYNAGGVATRRDPTGAAGTNVGDEVDVVLNFHLTNTSDFMVVYAQLFGEGFLQATSSATKSSSQEAVYAMYNFRW